MNNKCFLITLLFLLFSTSTLSNQSNTFADFEQQSIPVINSKDNSTNRLLWSQYENYPKKGDQLGYEFLSTDEAHSGNKSLKITVQKGHAYLHFYPKPTSSIWDFAHQHTQTTPWAFDTYNRLKFWVKLPSGIKRVPGGKKNTTFGTYYRKRNGALDSAESGGDHPYHYYNLHSTGQWHQIIVDTHPNHIRGVTGSREHGNINYPTKEPNFNYFDSLTRFYFDMEGKLPNKPANFYFDDFEFYQAHPDENIEQIYSLHGVFIKEVNALRIGWMRNKNENKIKHRIKYSFDDIYKIGWKAALPAPSGLVKPLGWGGYNGMAYRTNKINVEGRTKIYLAIKPENSDKFRQIEIPLNK
jgi:hypothetical protein